MIQHPTRSERCRGVSKAECKSGSKSDDRKLIVTYVFVLRVGIGVEDDVRVTREEGTISLLGDRDDFEFLDAPDFLSDLLAAILPGGFLVSSSLLEVLVVLAAVVSNVGI